MTGVDAVTDIVSRALGRRVASVQLLGRGTDHDAYEIDGSLVARIARDPASDPHAVEREVRLLGLVASRSPIPVPEVVAHDAAAGVTVTTRLGGVSLLDRPCPDPRRLSGRLADLLGALHATTRQSLAGLVEVDDHPMADRLTEATETVPQVAHRLTAEQLRLVERFVATAPPAAPTELVLAHNDLGAEHILADGDTITGVIDWSDAALADPAIDLGRLYRDLGPPTVLDIVERLGLGADELIPRAAFYARGALLEDLEHGLSTGDHRYADAALANLVRTFDEPSPDR